MLLPIVASLIYESAKHLRDEALRLAGCLESVKAFFRYLDTIDTFIDLEQKEQVRFHLLQAFRF